MAGPWEDYAPRSAPEPVEDGPWTQYAAPKAAPPAEVAPQAGLGSQVASGFLEGATGALGAPIDLANNLIVAPALKGVNAIFGTNLQPSAKPLGGSAGLREGMALAPQSDSVVPQMARRVAQSVGGAALPALGSGGSMGQIAAAIASAAGGGVGGAIAQQVAPNNFGAEIAGELLGGMGTGAAISGLADRSARRAAEKAVPTVQQLEQQAADKFSEAHRLGVTATQPQTQQLASDIRSIAQQEGLISPTGRVSEAYPKAREALRLVDDYAQGNMTVPQMQTARKVLADAAKSPDSAERRIATIMLKKFDDFTSPLAPQLAEARGLYSRAMRGDQLETLRELAGSRAGQFTGSGYENALRTEYRNLDRRITKGQERGWSPEQQEAIGRVAQGTPASNVARGLGKLAPTGVVSFGLGGGVPFTIGNAIGGPALGAALSGATMGTGVIARDIASRMGGRYADIAELLARNGGSLPLSRNDEVQRKIAEALMGSIIGSQPN